MTKLREIHTFMVVKKEVVLLNTGGLEFFCLEWLSITTIGESCVGFLYMDTGLKLSH